MGRLTWLRDYARARRRRLAAAGLAVALAAGGCAGRGHAETFVSIGTGDMAAVYYPVVQGICEATSSQLREAGFWCSPETTPGSAYNVDRVASGELEFGIVQSDVLNAAYKGMGRWHGKPVTNLRSVLSLFPELVTIIARAGANIHGVADLAGKRVSVGSQEGGGKTTWGLISPGFNLKTPVRLVELGESETTSALCSGKIDASFFIVAHPSDLVSHQLAACPSNLVAVDPGIVAALVGNYPFYTKGYIPSAPYHVAAEVPSIGPLATLVTAASSDPRMVEAVVKAIMAHLGDIKILQPVLAGLEPAGMVAKTLTAPAPLHPAAAAVYRQLGFIR